MGEKTLYWSKSILLHKDLRKYHWVYHKELQPKDRIQNLDRGGYTHLAISKAIKEKGIQKGVIAATKKYRDFYSEEEITSSFLPFVPPLFEVISKQKILDSEIVFEEELEFGIIWKSKLDLVIEDKGLWLGEMKTTKRYTPTLQALYHQQMQPWIYLDSLRKRYPKKKVLGIRMFISDTERCFVEDVPIQQKQVEYASRYKASSALYMDWVEKNWEHLNEVFSGGECIRWGMGKVEECPYHTLCLNITNIEYINGIIPLLYTKLDPEEHLEED